MYTVCVYNIHIDPMSTTIRLSEETKGKLAVLKREDESFDEAVARLLTAHQERDLMAGFGVLGDADTGERIRETHEAMDRGIDERVREIRDRADGRNRDDATGDDG